MLYPVYVHLGDAQHAYAVTFPDFPGCFAASDQLEDLPGAIQEAVKAHFHGDTDLPPTPSPLAQLSKLSEYQGGIWLLADVNISKIQREAPYKLRQGTPLESHG